MVDAYRDASLGVEDRVHDLLGRMDIDEKVAQLGCLWVTSLVGDDGIDHDAAASRLRHGIGQITRIGASTGLRPAGSAALMNELQRIVVERTRLGVPLLVHEESVAGYLARDATVFPQALGLACSWDPALLAEVGGVIREQMVAVGARLTLAPVLDVARDPRWGRVEETYGEDPVLCGTLGAAYVGAIQGDDLSQGVAATGKHFLGYALSEGGRNHGPVHLGPRELREVYAEPFAAAIRDAGLASVMNSYSSVDGVPCAGTEAILTGLLRDELGFDGVVVADYFAVDLLRTHHRTAATKADAAVQALRAGLDAELPATDCFAELAAEVAAGRLSIDVVDEAVRRVLRLKLRLGLFERPYVDAERAGSVFDTTAQRALARRAANEAVVVLTNNGVLPLEPDASIAVIGPGADDPRLLQGDYHYPAHIEIAMPPPASGDGAEEPVAEESVAFLPEAGGAFALGMHYTPHTTPLAAFRGAYGEDEVLHAPGCAVTGDDMSGLPQAAVIAGEADVAVVIVAGRSGLVPSSTVGEARDAMDLELTGVQAALVELVVATGTPTVVVVLSGRVHALEAIAGSAAALVQAFPLGEEGGAGLVDVLTGAVTPSGRLPVTLPRRTGQVPVYAGHRAGGRTSMFYSAYADGPTEPLFPFGHGLGYTTFGYSGLEVQAADTTSPIEVAVTVRNEGDRPGTEVVQLYGTDIVASTARPDRQLLGFARVELAPGAASAVRFVVDPSRLAFYDPGMRFVCEPGEHRFAVGSSSGDLALEAVVTLAGDVASFRQRDVVATRVEVGPAA